MMKNLSGSDIYFSRKTGPGCRQVAFLLPGNCLVETAVIHHWGEIHICLSTMAGCPVGCRHCATTYSPRPFVRKLHAEELVPMARCLLAMARKYAGLNPGLPVILSLSGHGEPLLNWEAVSRCARELAPAVDKIYLTTIGIVSVFEKILASGISDIHLFLSLHGSCDRERQDLIPKGPDKAGVDDLFSFANAFMRNGGRVVFNYMLTRDNSPKPSLERVARMMNALDRPAEIRFTGYTDIGYETGIRPFSCDAISTTALVRQMRKACPGWDIRYSALTGHRTGVACGQMRADILETDPKLKETV